MLQILIVCFIIEDRVGGGTSGSRIFELEEVHKSFFRHISQDIYFSHLKTKPIFATKRTHYEL